MSPPVYIYLMFVITWILLSAYVLARDRTWLREEWHTNIGAILAAGFLVLFIYMMILLALRISKVSYVVAVKEVRIVFSAYYGIIWLGEKHGRQKSYASGKAGGLKV